MNETIAHVYTLDEALEDMRRRQALAIKNRFPPSAASDLHQVRKIMELGLREGVKGVTRIEVIDHRLPIGETGVNSGRVYGAHAASVTLSVQDDGKTLKVFIDGERS